MSRATPLMQPPTEPAVLCIFTGPYFHAGATGAASKAKKGAEAGREERLVVALRGLVPNTPVKD